MSHKTNSVDLRKSMLKYTKIISDLIIAIANKTTITQCSHEITTNANVNVHNSHINIVFLFFVS